MHLTLRQIQIFLAVADTGSTIAAGHRVSLSQSATSGALKELESLLGVQLFDRIGKRLLLNDSGRALLPQARALLAVAQDIQSQFSLTRQGEDNAGVIVQFRIGASTTIGNYLLPRLVATFLDATATSKGAKIEVIIGNTTEVTRAVAQLEVDLGFIEGVCHAPELLAYPWIEDELVIVCAPTHPVVAANSSMTVDLQTLRQQRWLLRERGSGTRETVDSALLPHLHQWMQPMQFGSTEAIKQAAAEGLGFACISRCAVKDLITLGRLVEVYSVLPRVVRYFYLVHHGKKLFSPNLQRFIGHCKDTGLDPAKPEEDKSLIP